MRDATRSPIHVPSDLFAGAAAVLERVRTRAPHVHCITNAVAQNFSANMLLALGAVPSMTIAPDEVGEFAARAEALLVNLGTFDAERRAAAEIAIGSVARGQSAVGARSGVHRAFATAHGVRQDVGRPASERAAAQSGRVCGACRCAME